MSLVALVGVLLIAQALAWLWLGVSVLLGTKSLLWRTSGAIGSIIGAAVSVIPGFHFLYGGIALTPMITMYIACNVAVTFALARMIQPRHFRLRRRNGSS